VIRYLVGIDDTDNKESRGTGFLSRRLAGLIFDKGIGDVKGITRHQLFVHPDIPYTSQNSSACLDVMTGNPDNLKEVCRSFLLKESAEGSDAGLAISAYEDIGEAIVSWGKRAKNEVLSQDEAIVLALDEGVYLEGFTGNRDGIIGALAGVGLRKSGNDGRFIWLSGMEIRELRGSLTVSELLDLLKADQVISISGEELPGGERIELGEWVRPALIDNRITIIAEKLLNMPDYEWKTADREYIKSITG
jgi:hypothetical protein